LHIFDRSLELINPRRTAGFSPLAQKAIRYGVPQRLNPQVALYFQPRVRTGTGARRFANAAARSRIFSNRRAEINAINDEFRCASMVREDWDRRRWMSDLNSSTPSAARLKVSKVRKLGSLPLLS